eukprot:6195230-Pleurochrysis_carterae.AAC.1
MSEHASALKERAETEQPSRAPELTSFVFSQCSAAVGQGEGCEKVLGELSWKGPKSSRVATLKFSSLASID